jgi:hypothetical protein
MAFIVRFLLLEGESWGRSLLDWLFVLFCCAQLVAVLIGVD